MIKICNRFVDISPDYLVLAAQIGVQGGVIRLECLPGFNEKGRPNPGAMKQIIAKIRRVRVGDMWDGAKLKNLVRLLVKEKK